MSHRILITGSEGLVGTALRAALEAHGHHIDGLDLLSAPPNQGDVRDPGRVRAAVKGCDGVKGMQGALGATRDMELQHGRTRR